MSIESERRHPRDIKSLVQVGVGITGEFVMTVLKFLVDRHFLSGSCLSSVPVSVIRHMISKTNGPIVVEFCMYIRNTYIFRW